MNTQPLENPFWAALTSHQAHLGVRDDCAARYVPEVAPFAGVGDLTATATEQLARLVMPGESLYLLGLLPDLGAGWAVKNRCLLPQMVCEKPMAMRDGPQWIELGEPHRADMLALTALVFPGFFRPRTLEMGRYIGIYSDGQLVAMAGERLRVPGFQEISGVCTHPDHAGRGHAQRLVAEIGNAALARGLTPFLHVYSDNRRAIAVYEKLGFRLRAELPFCAVTRVAD
jgi:GNAT superfamily N-acetyltransferase